MGSTGSRSRLSQVAPCHSQTEGDLDQRASHPTSYWTIPATPTPLEQQHEPLGHRRTTQLPPLKLENPATFPPLSTGQGLERWGCPPLFYTQPGGTRWHRPPSAGRSPGGTDGPQSTGPAETASPPETSQRTAGAREDHLYR